MGGIEMQGNINIPCQKINNFILSCGNYHEPKAFSIEVLSALKNLCKFDQAVSFLLDGNSKVYDQHLVNIDKKWSTMYLEYFSKSEEGYYSLDRDFREDPSKPTIIIKSWAEESSNDFVPNYIRLRGIKYSLGFALFDINGIPRTIFALDKVKEENFTEEEITFLSIAIPHLNNLHKNFFYQKTSRRYIDKISWTTSSLTDREIEIIHLLCQGVSPTIISKSLYISNSTTNKHISNIYDKMNVSSIQELLVRLLG